MKSSPRRGLEVFDFKEEDELAESTSGKYQLKFKNPSSDNHASLKYEFLECVAQGTNNKTKDIGSVPCIDVDAAECDLSCDNTISYTPLGIAEEKTANMKELNDAVSLSERLSHEELLQFKLDNQEFRRSLAEQEEKCSSPRAPSWGNSQLNLALLDSPTGNEPVDMTSDTDDSMNQSSPSSPELGRDGVSLSNYALHHSAGDLEMDDINTTIVLYPDFVAYRDSYCTGPQLTFSHNCIKVTGSTEFKDRKPFDFQWEISDVVHIETQCFQRISTVIIKLRVVSKDAGEDDNPRGTSGIEELTITVVEPNWPEKQEDIKCLNVRYMAIWNVVNMVMGTDEDGSLERRHYFPIFDESFEDVVYPKGDSDAVSISKRDVDLLQPETFINDTIIDFYIKYLKNQIPHEERHRFHFFNSFFFRKLADLDKDPSSISDGKAAFQRVRKWTRKVDLFGKDYIFIPINFNLHWSLIVLCHPGDVAICKDEDIEKSLKVPCILHMDSIKGSHTGLKNLVQSYLLEEWKERQKEVSDEVSLKFQNMRFVPLELPQQENSFDCGLFLLHYLELFLAKAPVNFSPFTITKLSNYLSMNWFPPCEASLKRTLIQKLIFELLENRSREVSSAAFSDEDQYSKFPESNKNEIENEIDAEFCSERCSPGLTRQENLSCSGAGQGIEITLLSASSMRNSDSVNDSGLVLRELFEPGATSGSLLEQYQTFDQKSSYYHLNGAMSPGEEDAETGEQFMFMPSGDSGFHQMTGITSQNCGIPYSSRGYGAGTYDVGISLQTENGDVGSSPEPSPSASDDSEEVGIVENCPVGEDSDPNKKEQADERKSLPIEDVECVTDGLVSASSELLDTSIIEDSQDLDLVLSGNKNGGSLPPCLEILDKEVHLDSGMAKNGIVSCHDMQHRIGDDLVPESHEHQAMERIRDDLVPEPHEDQAMERIGDDLVPEPHEHEATERTGDDLVPEPHEDQAMERIGDDLVPEPHEHEATERTGDDLVPEPHEHEATERTGDDLVPEPHEHQATERIVDDLVLEPHEHQATERISDDLVPEPHEHQATKRVSDDQVPESDEHQAAKRLRLTPPLEGERVVENLNEDSLL